MSNGSISRDPDQTGPVSPNVAGGRWSPGMAEAGTGPLPVVRDWPDPASTTTPHAVAPSAPPHRRRASRDQKVVAFVLHQFPIGHMPVAATEPARHWPGGVEHPRTKLISDAAGLARVRSGAAVSQPHSQRPGVPAPEELLAGYQPCGQLSELEWERAFAGRSGIEWPQPPPAEPVVLAPDTVVDRLGDEAGRVLGVPETPLAERGVPPDYVRREYHRYRILRPLPVWRAVITSRFAQPGGGVDYLTTHPIVDLVTLGYLAQVPVDVGAEARTLRLRHVDRESQQEGTQEVRK